MNNAVPTGAAVCDCRFYGFSRGTLVFGQRPKPAVIHLGCALSRLRFADRRYSGECRAFQRGFVALAVTLAILVGTIAAVAQETDTPHPTAAPSPVDPNSKTPDNDNSRILGILPNYLTTPNDVPY